MACCIPIALTCMSRWVALLSYIRLVCCLGIAVHVCFLAHVFEFQFQMASFGKLLPFGVDKSTVCRGVIFLLGNTAIARENAA